MKYLLAIVGLLIVNFTFGQNQEKYSEFTKEAWSLYESTEYEKSAEKYKAAFDQLESPMEDSDFPTSCKSASVDFWTESWLSVVLFIDGLVFSVSPLLFIAFFFLKMKEFSFVRPFDTYLVLEYVLQVL